MDFLVFDLLCYYENPRSVQKDERLKGTISFSLQNKGDIYNWHLKGSFWRQWPPALPNTLWIYYLCDWFIFFI